VCAWPSLARIRCDASPGHIPGPLTCEGPSHHTAVASAACVCRGAGCVACQGGIHVGTLRGVLHAAAHRCTQHHRRQTLSSIGRERTIAYSRAVRSRSRGNGSRPAPWAGSAVAPVSRRLPPSDTAILCCSGSVTCVIPRPIGCSSLPSNWLQALEISLTPCNNGRKQRIVRPVSQKFVGQKTWPQAHTWPACCDAIPRIFLIASPAYVLLLATLACASHCGAP